MRDRPLLALGVDLCEIPFVSEFVDYTKRDIQLPVGCKDLLEVLNLQPTRGKAEQPPIFSGGLKDIHGHVARLLNSPGVSNRLLIQSKGAPMWLFYKAKQEPIDFRLMVHWPEVAVVNAVRAFFTQCGFVGTEEFTGKASQIFRYNLPGDSGMTSSLIVELLKSVYGLGDEARIYFAFGR